MAGASLERCAHPTELQTWHGLRTFRLERTCCYEALLLDEERGRLFVGAENHVASLNLDNISKRAKKVAGSPGSGRESQEPISGCLQRSGSNGSPCVKSRNSPDLTHNPPNLPAAGLASPC